METNKRKVAFENTCEYCGKVFKTSMPFARFCSDNHRKYYSNLKRKYKIAIQEQAIKEFGKMFKAIKEAATDNNGKMEVIAAKMDKAAARMQSIRKVNENIDVLVKEYLKENKHIK